MGFPEGSARVALEHTSNRSLEVGGAACCCVFGCLDAWIAGRAAVQSHHVRVGLQQAIDFMMNNPPSSAQPAAVGAVVAVAPSVPTAAAVPAAATPPQPKVCHLRCFSHTNASCDGAPSMA